MPTRCQIGLSRSRRTGVMPMHPPWGSPLSCVHTLLMPCRPELLLLPGQKPVHPLGVTHHSPVVAVLSPDRHGQVRTRK